MLGADGLLARLARWGSCGGSRPGLTDFDTEALRQAGSLPRSRVDRALRRLSGVANYSVPWLSVTAVLALRRGRSRRAALRGLFAVAGSSALATRWPRP